MDPAAPPPYRLDVGDDTFLVAAPEAVAAVVADPAVWAVWWPDLQLTVTRARGVKGQQWAMTGALRGSLEIWLEPWGDGVVLHWYLFADPRGSRRRTARERARRARSWKRHVFALKDRLEEGREPGRPRLPRGGAGVKDLDGPAEGHWVGTTISHELRCPKCGAHALAAADWCSLCYADLRPPPEPEPAVEPGPAVEPAATDGAAPVTPAAGAGTTALDTASSRGKHARRAATQDSVTNRDPTGDLPADVDVGLMLAQLAAETSSPLGSLGALMDRFDTKASRALVICGGVAAVGVLLLVAMTIMGALL